MLRNPNAREGAIVRIVAFSGSVRRDSYNQRLVALAARGAEEAGAVTTVVSLREFGLPVYDADHEAERGIPAAALALKALLAEADGLLIAAPEYNSSITALLKNTLDWLSRPTPGENPFAFTGLRGKVAGLMSASTGRLGGLRGLNHVREILTQLFVLVPAEQVSIPFADQAFDGAELTDPALREAALAQGRRVVELVQKLHRTD